MNTIDNLKRLIARSETKQVISKLLAITKDANLLDEVIQQSARLEQYEQEKRLGTQFDENLNIKLSRINNALLAIINKLPSTIKENTVATKSFTEREQTNNKMWKYVTGAAIIIGILGSLAEILNFINIIPENTSTTNSVTILVHGEKGKDEIVLPNRGVVYLIYGDAKFPEQINNEGEATFKQIPNSFFQPEAKVEIIFKDPKGESYRAVAPDSLYDLKDNSYIALEVILEGIEQISGIVKDSITGNPIDSAMIRVFGKETFSNEHGEFVLDIPENQQRQFITLRAFKNGYQRWEKEDVQTTLNREIGILLKKENTNSLPLSPPLEKTGAIKLVKKKKENTSIGNSIIIDGATINNSQLIQSITREKKTKNE